MCALGRLQFSLSEIQPKAAPGCLLFPSDIFLLHLSHHLPPPILSFLDSHQIYIKSLLYVPGSGLRVLNILLRLGRQERSLREGGRKDGLRKWWGGRVGVREGVGDLQKIMASHTTRNVASVSHLILEYRVLGIPAILWLCHKV